MHALRRKHSDQSSEHSKDKDEVIPASARNLAHHTAIDPLSGVLNHLTETQVHKLDEFKEKLSKDGWWTPNGPNGRPSHDDGTLLRFLRARKFDVAGAIGQFTDTEKWLKEQHVEELYEHFDVETYERARLLYPQWTGRRDRRGIPIYVFVIKDLDTKNVAHYQKESQKYKESLPNHKKLKTPAKLLPLFALYQNLLNFVLPFVSTLERPHPEVPVTTSTNIVDVSGVGLAQFWNLKNHMQDASVLATAHYPETLDRIFIVGAPSYFPTVWGWIKRWFDPVTVSKIFILSKHDVLSTLSKFMEPKDIPTRYGGQLQWDWGGFPDLDEPGRAALERGGSNPDWVKGPCLWLDNQRIVVGSEKGKLRQSHPNIDSLKPVVYAADYTEQPVHPDRKASGSGGGANGKLDNHHHEAHKASDTTATPAAATAPIASNHASRPTSKTEAAALPSTTTEKTAVIDANGHLEEPTQPSSTAVPTSLPSEKQSAPDANPTLANGTLPIPATNTLAQDLEKVGLEAHEQKPETGHVVAQAGN